MENKEDFIVCPKCNAKYKKPVNIPEKGVSVKCKKCGNLFFVPFEGTDENEFFIDSLVRKPDATIIRIKDFQDLTKKIVNEEIYASDEISKDGKIWKTVGELNETKDAFTKVVTPMSDVEAFFKTYFLRSTEKEVVEMKNLAELQKKIVALEVDENFEVSKNQNSWYKLSTIDELRPFFELIKLKAGEKNQNNKMPKKKTEDNVDTTSVSNLEVLTPKFAEEKKVVETTLDDKIQEVTEEKKANIKKEEKEEDDDFSSLFEEEEDFNKPKKSNLKLILIAVLVVLVGGFAVFVGGGFIGFSTISSSKNVSQKVKRQNVKTQKTDLDSKKSVKIIEQKDKHPKEKVEKTEKQQPKVAKLKEPKKHPLKQAKKTVHSSKFKKIASCSSLVNKGWNLIDKGRMSVALKIFKTAINNHPKCYGAYYGIGESYNELGKKKQALKNYKLFLKFSPNSKDASEVRRIIKDFNQ